MLDLSTFFNLNRVISINGLHNIATALIMIINQRLHFTGATEGAVGF